LEHSTPLGIGMRSLKPLFFGFHSPQEQRKSGAGLFVGRGWQEWQVTNLL
jgi:hypothetical protein